MSSLINTGKKLFYNGLLKNKVDVIHIYSGGAVMPLIDGLYNGTIKTVVNSNELCTGLSSIGYAKSSDKTGVACVTSGPGITNMITSLLDAKNDNVPMVVFSGQVPLAARGTNAFQEAPAIELTKHVTKWNYQLTDINEMESVIDEAFSVANDGKKGPVHIDIPKCVSYQTNDKSITIDSNKKINNHIDLTEYELYNVVADMINNSERPILYVGQGCVKDYGMLRDFAIKANIPVTTTIHGCGIFDEHHPLSLRWCGMHGNVAANYGLQNADTIIAIGSRFDDRTTGNIAKYAPKAFEAYNEGNGGIIHVNINKDELGFVVDSHYNFNQKSGVFLANLMYRIRKSNREPWLNYLNDIQNKYPFDLKQDNTILNMENVINELYEQTIDKDTIFTTGVGNHQMQAYQFIKCQYPKKILSSGSLGVMGAGLPYAVGAQLANPNKLVIDIDGDSSFNMTLTDLKTIAEHNLPIKIAVMNNSSQMMVEIWERLFYEERYTATKNEKNPSYTALANSYGIKAMKCTSPNALQKTVDMFVNSKGPVLCEFVIEPDICLPLVGPGNALDEMILPKNEDPIELMGMSPS